MKFFILETDARYHHYPHLKNWAGKVDYKYLTLNEEHKIEGRQILMIEERVNTVFTDFISFPFPMIAEPIKEVFDLYEPYIIYKQVILLDQKYERTNVYYVPILPECSCLTEDSILNRDRSILKKGIVQFENTNECAVFRLGDVNHYYVCVRFDLVESILKRCSCGIGLRELEVVGGRVV